MNRKLLLAIILMAGFSACRYHSECPVESITIDENGMVLSNNETPKLTMKQRKELLALSSRCIPNRLYKVEQTCHLDTDTTFWFGFLPVKVTTSKCCDISALNPVGNVDMAPTGGFFVIFPEFIVGHDLWVAYVSDTVTDAVRTTCQSLFADEHPAVYHFDKKWGYHAEISY